jgi:hypothetical protein
MELVGGFQANYSFILLQFGIELESIFVSKPQHLNRSDFGNRSTFHNEAKAVSNFNTELFKYNVNCFVGEAILNFFARKLIPLCKVASLLASSFSPHKLLNSCWC